MCSRSHDCVPKKFSTNIKFLECTVSLCRLCHDDFMYGVEATGLGRGVGECARVMGSADEGG